MIIENKQLICDSLLFALKLTRRFEDLTNLIYDEKTETVTPIYFNGNKSVFGRSISVECDSGIAMIRDVLDNL